MLRTRLPGKSTKAINASPSVGLLSSTLPQAIAAPKKLMLKILPAAVLNKSLLLLKIELAPSL